MKELDYQLHNIVESDNDLYHYCTAIYMFIDTTKQTIEYINAGHPPAIYLDKNGRQKELKTTVPPIGLFKGIDFHSSTFSYTKGARLLLYTDGVSEPLEENRLGSLLKDSTTLTLENVKDKLSKTLEEDGNKCYKNDDQCFILIDLK
ncbi:sigma-B regulation protein RsbU (phosphoserine phosphatase) [Mesobacillus persicus]|uniref:Sigma-B regulation protein RsbU (Phosphoserine phosphatase) n=2 Tax=Mesobacillus persicus TaxID=930146 RepID=A0A1H7Z0T2_9BACI|nr:sigma-B regulation protein RsbU (phosphoserine phosphatase) [Mesobacillus persicus]